jgi:hypothetical protein
MQKYKIVRRYKMDIKILRVNVKNEYVVLKVINNCDLINYGIADKTFDDKEKKSNRLRHFYWFPKKEVKKNERIILHTKNGNPKTETTKDGVILHRFYWGLKSDVWNDGGDEAVLFNIAEWQIEEAEIE